MENKRKYSNEEEALKIILEESSKKMEEMDMELITKCLYYLYPPNEEEDRAFIERTWPVLCKKLGFKSPEEYAREKRRKRCLMIAAIIIGTAFAIACLIRYFP